MGKTKEQLAATVFLGARRKIKRADQHIDNLNSIFKSFLDSDFYGFSIQNDVDTGNTFMEYSVEPMPDCVPLILGDAIHNLRSSLDLVFAELTGISHKADDPQVYSNFPFCKTRDKFIAAINKRLKKTVSSAVLDVILNEVKSYDGGNSYLWDLHRLDIQDKHFLIVPTISMATVRGVDMTYGELRMHNCTLICESGNRIRWAGDSPNVNLKVHDKGQATCKIVFADPKLLWMQPVIPTLHQLSQLVTGCVDAIAKAHVSSI